MDGILLNDINDHIRHGGNVTHILDIKASLQASIQTALQILQEIFCNIQGNPITKTVNDVSVTITWRSTSYTTLAYHADVGGIYGDVAV
jgi:hypothetical protein